MLFHLIRWKVADQCMNSWQDAATEHVQLHSMYEVGAPYMTIYQQGPIQCSHHRILRELFPAQGDPRTTQAFLCTGPGGLTVDINNVHAPSGRPILTDLQRMTLLENMLQSSSFSMPGMAIGCARFLICGDMNTDSFQMSQLLQEQRAGEAAHPGVAP